MADQQHRTEHLANSGPFSSRESGSSTARTKRYDAERGACAGLWRASPCSASLGLDSRGSAQGHHTLSATGRSRHPAKLSGARCFKRSSGRVPGTGTNVQDDGAQARPVVTARPTRRPSPCHSPVATEWRDTVGQRRRLLAASPLLAHGATAFARCCTMARTHACPIESTGTLRILRLRCRRRDRPRASAPMSCLSIRSLPHRQLRESTAGTCPSRPFPCPVCAALSAARTAPTRASHRPSSARARRPGPRHRRCSGWWRAPTTSRARSPRR